MLEAALLLEPHSVQRETALATVKYLLSIRKPSRHGNGQQQHFPHGRSNGAYPNAMSGAKKIKSAVITNFVETRVKVTKRNVRGMTNTSQVISNIFYNFEQ